ncbi:uncharacterized protein [Clytia hemisphaerica]
MIKMKLFTIMPLVLNIAYCIQPQFKNAQPYTPIDSTKLDQLPTMLNATNPGPYGFSSATILYHGNIQESVNNPVIEIKNGMTGTQIQIRVETKVNGASICVMDDVPQDGSENCGKGQIDVCYTPARDGMKFEYYCTESCDSDDVGFYYRIVKSPVGADDLWCTNLPQYDWPSNLQPTPRTLPPRGTTPPNLDQDSSSITNQAKYSVVLALASVICLFLWK